MAGKDVVVTAETGEILAGVSGIEHEDGRQSQVSMTGKMIPGITQDELDALKTGKAKTKGQEPEGAEDNGNAKAKASEKAEKADKPDKADKSKKPIMGMEDAEQKAADSKGWDKERQLKDQAKAEQRKREALEAEKADLQRQLDELRTAKPSADDLQAYLDSEEPSKLVEAIKARDSRLSQYDKAFEALANELQAVKQSLNAESAKRQATANQEALDSLVSEMEKTYSNAEAIYNDVVDAVNERLVAKGYSEDNPPPFDLSLSLMENEYLRRGTKRRSQGPTAPKTDPGRGGRVGDVPVMGDPETVIASMRQRGLVA